MVAEIALTRSTVTEALKGQALELPDFSSIYSNWPVKTSPHLDWIRQEISTRLTFLVAQIDRESDRDHVLRRLKRADFGLFAATWWPDLTREQLRLMAYCIIWLFMWDDEIDSEQSNLGHELSTAHSYRQRTLDFITTSLGLADAASEACNNVLITSVADVLAPIVSAEKGQRKRFLEEIEFFIHATETEQMRRLENRLPRLDEYISCRMGTSAVGVCVVLHNILVEEPMVDSNRQVMDEMMLQTNMMISITNDILSLKKELAAGTPDSVIPILWQRSRRLQEAVSDACGILKLAKSRFDEAERRLFSTFPDLSIFRKRQYAEMCKTNCTGNVTWSVMTGRYGISEVGSGKTHFIVL